MKTEIQRRVREVMPEQSPIDLDLHAKSIAEVVADARAKAARYRSRATREHGRDTVNR